MKKGGLGKGLDAIFAENTTESGNNAVQLRISELEPNREQPRKDFDEKSMAELADSIAQHGLLQPLLVRPVFGGGYQIVAGERRWRAARMAGLSEVPAVVREMSDHEVMELALIENLQREDLTPLEEARGYQTLLERYDMTQEEVARQVDDRQLLGEGLVGDLLHLAALRHEKFVLQVGTGIAAVEEGRLENRAADEGRLDALGKDAAAGLLLEIAVAAGVVGVGVGVDNGPEGPAVGV